MRKAAIFWSGGKDSAMALHRVLSGVLPYRIQYLVTTINEHYHRVSMHGIREELLMRQSKCVGIPLLKMYVSKECTNEEYEAKLHQTLLKLKSEGIEAIIFGDIFLEELRAYREHLLEKAGMKGVFPLWKADTKTLLNDFIRNRFRTITCCVSSTHLDEQWVGREIDRQFLIELPDHVDPCGENGEFHTFCFDGPVFQKKVDFRINKPVFKQLNLSNANPDLQVGFWYADLV